MADVRVTEPCSARLGSKFVAQRTVRPRAGAAAARGDRKCTVRAHAGDHKAAGGPVAEAAPPAVLMPRVGGGRQKVSMMSLGCPKNVVDGEGPTSSSGDSSHASEGASDVQDVKSEAESKCCPCRRSSAGRPVSRGLRHSGESLLRPVPAVPNRRSKKRGTPHAALVCVTSVKLLVALKQNPRTSPVGCSWGPRHAT